MTLASPAAVSDEAAADTTAAGTAACANCGETLRGAYCHACGQEDRPALTTMRGFLRQVAADLSNLDRKALLSVVLLLFRPGLLTAEYLAGRRVRYASPLQLYLGAAALFFLVNAYRPFVRFDPRTREVVSSLSAAKVSGTMAAEEVAHLAAQGVTVELFAERFQATVSAYLPALLLASVLVLACVLWLFHRRAAPVSHLVFALHWTAFFLLMMSADRMFPGDRSVAGPVPMLLAVASIAYLTVALRRVHGQGWVRSAAKGAGVLFVFYLLLAAWMASAMSLAFAMLTS